jgi:hypothetical protein
MLTQLPDAWQGLALSCSFDRKGDYPLPQNQPVFVPLEAKTEVINSSGAGSSDNFGSEITSAPTELRIHWEDLEMFRMILDEVECKLELRVNTNPGHQLKPKKRSWIKKILGVN